MSRLPHVGRMLLGLLLIAGCMDAKSKPADDNSGKGIFGKKTQDIGEFDKNKAKQVVSDSKVQGSDPLSASMSAYGSSIEKISSIEITSALNLFYGENGRYPKDYDEFMEKIIQANNIKLQVLPYKGRYEYDVEKHELRAVYDRDQAAKKDGQ
jgi:hypothetical protein